MMAKMTRKQAQSRNWQIKRLRGAYSLLREHYVSREALAEIDRALKVLGAEGETERRARLFHEHLDNLKKV